MMEYENEPKERGACRQNGYVEEHDPYFMRRVGQLQHDVEVHGHVHAEFDSVEGEVEISLRTVTFNYKRGTIEIWDGDNETPFSMEHLVSWELPMDVQH